MHQLKFIYFDVGGVAILDFSKTNKWDELLNALNISDNKKDSFTKLFKAHEKNICKGENIEIFLEEVGKMLKIQFPDNYDMTADFVNRFEINPSMLKLFKKLRSKFKLGLLTGQYPNMLNLIFERKLLPKSIWDVIIDSSVEGFTKPEPEIYHLAEKLAGVEPQSILFVDNKAKLLEYPRSRGWRVFEYDPSSPIISTRNLENFINKL